MAFEWRFLAKFGDYDLDVLQDVVHHVDAFELHDIVTPVDSLLSNVSKASIRSS